MKQTAVEFKHTKVVSESGNELFFDKEGKLIKELKQETVEVMEMFDEIDGSKTFITKEDLEKIIKKEEPKQETQGYKSKFIVFTLQDGEDWVQHSIPLDSFEKADEFCQQFRDRKMSYLICQTLKQGYNEK